MKTFSPCKQISTFVVTGFLVAGLALSGCSEHTLMGPEAGPNATGTSVTNSVDNREAHHNGSGADIYLDKNGENATTYGGDHNL